MNLIMLNLFLDKNGGFGGKPRNIGMIHAAGDYGMFLDLDASLIEDATKYYMMK